MYYFNEVIKPMTTINGQEVKVPVYYYWKMELNTKTRLRSMLKDN